MDLPFLDLMGVSTDAAPASTSCDALTLAAHGDWHAAAESFADALAVAERGDDDVTLAVALTNLGQAHAHLGAMDESARLLTRSVDARWRLLDAGIVGPAIVVRGLVDLAAVHAAGGATAAARDALLRARGLSDGSDATLMYVVAQGLAMLDDDSGTELTAALEIPSPAASHVALADLAFLTFDEAPADQPIVVATAMEAMDWELDAEPIAAGGALDFMTLDEPEPIEVRATFDESLSMEPLPWLIAEAVSEAVAAEAEAPVADTVSLPEPLDIESAAPGMAVETAPVAEPQRNPPAEPPTVPMAEPITEPSTPTTSAPAVAPPRASRWWQRLGRRRA